MKQQFHLLLLLLLLILSTLVLVIAIQFGWKHTMGFGGNFNSSSLKIPLDWFGGEAVRVKLRYMYGSLLFGMIMMLSINIELILRSVVLLFSPDAELPDDGSSDQMVRAD